MTTSAQRKAMNEGMFRDANEQLERAAGAFVDAEDRLVPFLCECPSVDCTKVVLLTLGEYEQVRATARGGCSAVGHDDPSIERVVAQNERFLTTEKFGEAGRVHAERDPRS